MLCKFNQGIRIKSTIDAYPGHLFIVDFDLIQEDVFKQYNCKHLCSEFRMMVLYAPVCAVQRKQIWQVLQDHLDTRRDLIIVGDFNIRSEPEDRIRGGSQHCQQVKPLIVEERKLKQLLKEKLQLMDVGLQTTCELDFILIHQREFF